MQDLFELTPELLMEQSQEMFSLCSAYENLFSNISSDLNGINGSWSNLLSNNFSGKIGSAQKAFSGALNMLRNSANSARSVAETAQEMDTAWATRIGGVIYNPTVLDSMLAKAMESGKGDLKEFEKIYDDLTEGLPSSAKAWIEKIGKKINEAILGKELKDPVKIATEIVKGEYDDALSDLSEAQLKVLIKAVASTAGVTLESSDIGNYAKYTVNLVEDVSEAVTECLMGEATVGKALNFAWSCTGKPILETAGSTIYETVNLIPGISEYYAECGVEDADDMARVALQEYINLATGDEEAAEYIANYYENNGGLASGLDNFGSEVFSFVKDSGGLGEALKNFGRTAIKDIKDALDYRIEVEKMCWSSILKPFTQK